MEMPSLHLHCCWTRRRCFHLSVCLFFWCTHLFNTQSAPHLCPLTFAEHILNSSLSRCQQLELLPHPTCLCCFLNLSMIKKTKRKLFVKGNYGTCVRVFFLTTTFSAAQINRLTAIVQRMGEPFSAVSLGWILFSPFLPHRSANSPHR